MSVIGCSSICLFKHWQAAVNDLSSSGVVLCSWVCVQAASQNNTPGNTECSCVPLFLFTCTRLSVCLAACDMCTVSFTVCL